MMKDIGCGRNVKRNGRKGFNFISRGNARRKSSSGDRKYIRNKNIRRKRTVVKRLKVVSLRKNVTGWSKNVTSWRNIIDRGRSIILCRLKFVSRCWQSSIRKPIVTRRRNVPGRRNRCQKCNKESKAEHSFFQEMSCMYVCLPVWDFSDQFLNRSR
jgi:hypothetical protein